MTKNQFENELISNESQFFPRSIWYRKIDFEVINYKLAWSWFLIWWNQTELITENVQTDGDKLIYDYWLRLLATEHSIQNPF